MKIKTNLSRRTVLLGGAAVAISFPQVRAQNSKKPFVFGVALPLTGPAAPGGADQLQSLEWAVQDINASGGAGGRPLEVIAVDTQAKPQVGVDAVTRLVSFNKVPLFVAAYSAVVAAVAPIANRTQTLMLVAGATSPRISAMGDFVYTTYPLADVDITLLAKYVRAEMKKENAAVIFLNDESGIYGARIFRDTFTAAGGKIVAFESYESNATDYTGALLKKKSSNPDVVHLQGNAGDSPQVMSQLRQLGISVPVTSYNAAYSPQLISQVGPAADGLIVASLAPGVTDNANLTPFLQRWRREKAREPNLLAANQVVSDTAYIVKSIVEHADKAGKELNGVNLRQSMLEIGKFDQPLSGAVIIDNTHRVVKPVYLLEVKKGKFEPIATFK